MRNLALSVASARCVNIGSPPIVTFPRPFDFPVRPLYDRLRPAQTVCLYCNASVCQPLVCTVGATHRKRREAGELQPPLTDADVALRGSKEQSVRNGQRSPRSSTAGSLSTIRSLLRCMDARAERTLCSVRGSPALHWGSGPLCPSDSLGARQPVVSGRRSLRSENGSPGSTLMGVSVHESLRAGWRRTRPSQTPASAISVAAIVRTPMDELRDGYRANLPG